MFVKKHETDTTGKLFSLFTNPQEINT